MVKNLSQLKKTLKKGTCFEITGHCRPEYVGQKRKVTVANTQGLSLIHIWLRCWMKFSARQKTA